MSEMEISVSFLGGTSIKDAISEARDKAIKWDVAYINFDFNGVKVSISPDCMIDRATKEYKEASKSDDPEDQWVID